MIVSRESSLPEFLRPNAAQARTAAAILDENGRELSHVARPKSATGGIPRIELTLRPGEALAAAFAAPIGPREILVADTIATVLQGGPVGRHDNFFALGGDSLRGTQVLLRLGAILRLDLPPTTLFRVPTPALLARRLDHLVAEREIKLLTALLAKLPAADQAAWIESALAAGDAVAAPVTPAWRDADAPLEHVGAVIPDSCR